MEPKGSEGLKIGLAGMIGCFLAVSLAWHWSESIAMAMLSFPVGFVAGWIAYAPISFFAAWPRAWRRATSWRPPVGAGVNFMSLMTIAFGALSLGTFVGMPLLALEKTLPTPSVDRAGPLLGWQWLLIGPGMSVFVLTVGVMSCLLMAPMSPKAIEGARIEVKEVWKFNLRWNILTIPFYWLPFWLIRGFMKTPTAIVATVKRVVQMFVFSVCLVRALAEITASNGRLTSGASAALGYGICLWQNWPPIPGSLIGFVVGFGLWGLATLALRLLPAPCNVKVEP